MKPLRKSETFLFYKGHSDGCGKGELKCTSQVCLREETVVNKVEAVGREVREQV